jgi:hypothetical protein
MLRNALVIVALTAVACGGKDGSGNKTPVQVDTDMGAMVNNSTTNNGITNNSTVDPDMGPVFEVPTPAGLLLRMTPGRETYPVGIRLLPEVEIYDVWGDLSDFDYEITVEPADAAMAVDDRFEMVGEGVVRFTACTVDPGPDGEPVCGWDEVVVNNSPPTIDLFEPTAGEMLDAINDPTITVSGHVHDTFGDITAFVNGVAVQLEPDGTFTMEVAPRFGVNHIIVEASDGLSSDTSVAAVDVLWANDYTPMTDPPVQESDAIELRLGQLFMDDRLPYTTMSDGSILTEDLADIFGLVVSNFDIGALIPDPVIDSSAFTLRVPSIDLGEAIIQIDLVSGGIEMFIQLPSMVAQTEGSFTFDNTALDLDGDISVGMSALVVLSVNKQSSTAPIDVSVDAISVAVESATPNFASDEANAIFALATSVLYTTLEQLLLDSLQGSFIDEIPALLTDVFSALDETLAGQSVDLDTGIGQPITLDIDGGVDLITTKFRDHLTAQLRLDASTSQSNLFADSRGTALLWERDSAPFFQQSRVQFGIRFPLVNSLLHALWQAGLLDADVTDFVPVNVDSATLSAKLPPIVRPPLEGEPHDLVIELGQIEVATGLLGQQDVYGVNIATGVDFGIENGALALEVSDQPKITSWLISSTGEMPVIPPAGLETLIETQVWPEFTTAFAGGLSIPLPAPDLSGLGNVAAPLAGLTLDYVEKRPLAVREGWLILDANIEGTLPP